GRIRSSGNADCATPPAATAVLLRAVLLSLLLSLLLLLFIPVLGVGIVHRNRRRPLGPGTPLAIGPSRRTIIAIAKVCGGRAFSKRLLPQMQAPFDRRWRFRPRGRPIFRRPPEAH